VTFNSIEYALFLALVVGSVWCLRHRAQNVLLLVASYLFYAAWDWRFLALLLGSTIIGYTAGLSLEAAESPARRRSILITRVALNLAVLAVFKYANFFLDTASDLVGALGFDHSEPTLRIVLPIAISYYTFEEIAYTVDIYRRRIKPCRDPVAYGLFVAFFPKLVAGPILRPGELLPQITSPRRRPGRQEVADALGLLLRGLIKKVVVADILAVYADSIYSSADQQGAVMLMVGTLCFAGQIYGDFSGYTDLARGASRLLGFELPENFRQPYLSSSITAFWRTWHISLSSWLRDYLYIPLGGSRRGTRRTMINLMTVMLLGGLWHGAGWTFVIWGGIHGMALATERLTGTAVDNSDRMPTVADLPRIALTFSLVTLAWVFFRAPDLGAASTVVWRILTLRGGELIWSAIIWLAVCGAVVVANDLAERRAVVNDRPDAPPAPSPLLTRPFRSGALVGVAVAALVVASGSAPVPFIYYQF
jgi:D-alanyl-lipoteichoic acid acyltransferase DltB (MBOAT superfamily)